VTWYNQKLILVTIKDFSGGPQHLEIGPIKTDYYDHHHRQQHQHRLVFKRLTLR